MWAMESLLFVTGLLLLLDSLIPCLSQLLSWVQCYPRVQGTLIGIHACIVRDVSISNSQYAQKGGLEEYEF